MLHIFLVALIKKYPENGQSTYRRLELSINLIKMYVSFIALSSKSSHIAGDCFCFFVSISFCPFYFGIAFILVILDKKYGLVLSSYFLLLFISAVFGFVFFFYLSGIAYLFRHSVLIINIYKQQTSGQCLLYQQVKFL